MADEERLQILRMVAEGKITPEQGVELLKALGPQREETRGAGPAAGEPGRRYPAEEIEIRLRKAQEKAEEAARAAAARAETLAEEAGKKAEYIGKAVSETVVESLRGVFEGLLRGGVGWLEGVGAPGDEYELVDVVTGELPSEGEVQVNLSTTNGRIEVVSTDQTGYALRVIKRVRAASEEEARSRCENLYEFRQDGLVLTGRSKDSFAWRGAASCAFRLELPRGRATSLSLDTANGRIEVHGLEGTRLLAATANGRIVVEGCRFGETTLDTANGRIEFQGSSERLRADTANGRIEARLSGKGDWNLESANGRIEVGVERTPGVGYEIDLSTNLGSISVAGLDDAYVLQDDRGRRWGPRRYHARTKGFSEAAEKATLKASTSVGKIEISF